jgi:hypothetical protein
MRIANPNVLGSFVHGAVFRYATYFLLVLIIVSVSAVTVFKAEADVAIFYSDNYLEKGVEIAHEEDGKKYIQYEYSWSDFKGSIPEGTFANSITLNLSWSLVTRSLVDVEVDAIAEDAGSSEGIGVVQVETSASEQILVDETVDVVVDTEVEPEIGETTLPEVEDSPASPDETIPPERTPEPDLAPVPIESLETESVPVSEDPAEESVPSETEGFEPVSLNAFFSLAQAVVEEPITDSPLLESTSSAEVIIAESISTTSGFVSSDIVTVSSSTDFFEVRYTLDGSTWYEIGRIGFDESQETTLDLSSIGTDALPNLQVEVRYTVPAESEKKILIDSLELHVGYDVLPVEIIEEPIPFDERTPNFEVSAIKADVQSENIRAVILERGGTLEFWYSVTVSGEVVWDKILGGGPVDTDAPIAIEKRTIFWLDRNQQTLYGFSVDEKSIFAASFQNPEYKVFRLPFLDEREKNWEASFNVEQNALEFYKVRTESP